MHFLDTARARVEAQDLDGALDAVREGLEVTPDEPRAWLLAGWLRGRLGDYEGAVEAYGVARERLPLLGDCTDLLRSDLALAEGRFGEAEAGYLEALEAYPDSPWVPRMLFGLGRAAWALGHWDRARDALEAFQSGGNGEDETVEALGLLGAVCTLEEDWLEAREAYHRLWRDYPDRPEALAAADSLEALRLRQGLAPIQMSAEQMLERAQKLAGAGALDAALDQLDEILHTYRGSEIAPEALYEQARIYFRQGENRRALEKLKHLTKDYPGADAAPDGMYLMARSHWRGGYKHRFASTCREVQETYPGSRAAADAEFALAVFYLEEKEWAKARSAFQDLSDQDPENPRRRDALWQLGRMEYSERRFDQANRSFSTLAFDSSSGYWKAGLYWSARCLEHLGRSEEAADEFRELAVGCPGNYYGIQAVLRLDRMGLGDPREDSRADQAGVDFHLPDGWGGDRYLRVSILEEVGFYSLALEQMNELLEGAPPGARLRFARLAQKAGQFPRGMDQVENYYGDLIEKSAPGLPRGFWETAFPVPHADKIERAALEFGQDPLLVAAVVREESRFDERAVSSAGALGLMQLMPGTAREEARRLGVPYRGLDLLDPATNLRLGTASLSRRLDQFDGDLILALAGYNAGDRRAKEWRRDLRGLERDEFIDQMPYRETRLYVKRILASYDHYRRIYRPEG